MASLATQKVLKYTYTPPPLWKCLKFYNVVSRDACFENSKEGGGGKL